MELVYLWVEEYKNIKNQGFNFSPRFTCKYEDGELTIDEKEHVSIFPENINITAIVGENGSGKSSILKLFKKILDYIPYTGELGNVNSKQKYPFDFIFVINIDGEKQYISSFDIKSENIKKVRVLGHYNYYLYLADEQKPVYEEYQRNEPIVRRFSLDNNVIANMLTSQYISIIDFDLTTFMYLPVKIEIKPLGLHTLFANLTDKYEQGYGVSDIDLSHDMSDAEFEQARKDIKCQSLAKKDDLDNIFEEANDDFHRFLIIWYIRENGDENFYEFNDKDFLLREYNELQDSITEDEFNQYFKEEIKEIDSFSKRQKEIYFKYCNYLFEFDFIDSESRKFNDLSHGEQTIFSQFLNIYYFSLHDKDKIFIYLMDEPDLSLHPQWQKNYFFELYNLLNKIDMTYHVLITTHSPFILSDLPKENVIFLEKGKQVYPFENKQTFGANIHTLLSHGFFMKDGLMGEFAKGKIDKAIKYLNQKSLSKEEIDYCENIISIIGEPIIKNQLQKMLDSKRLSEVEQIKQEIKRLEDRMTLIWKNS